MIKLALTWKRKKPAEEESTTGIEMIAKIKLATMN